MIEIILQSHGNCQTKAASYMRSQKPVKHLK